MQKIEQNIHFSDKSFQLAFNLNNPKSTSNIYFLFNADV